MMMEDESVVRVLCIGQYNGEGKFIKEQWNCFIEWCEMECNKVVIYSPMTYSTVLSKFSLYCNISELKKPDETLDVHAYTINVMDSEFWNYIKNYNFNIDITDNISHIFFFSSEKHMASLEIVDYENYLFMEEFIACNENLSLNENLIQENIRLCIKGKADVDELLQGESWKPFGNTLYND